MTPTSVSQVFEALCKLIIGLAFAWLVMKLTGGSDMTLGAGGAILGVTLGCVVSAVYLWRCFDRAAKDLPTGGDVQTGRQTLRQLLSIAIPITLGSAGLQIINTVDTMVYMRRLVNAVGMVQADAEHVKGVYNFCQTIFNLPCALITPITISVIPAITACLTKKDDKTAAVTEGSALRIASLIAMPCAMGLAFMANPIMNLFGDTGEQLILSTQIMTYLGIAVIFNSLVLVTNAIMQAHGDVTTPVKNMIIGGVVKVVLNYFLVGIPSLNIVGAAMGTVVCYALITALNIFAMIRHKLAAPKLFLTIGRPLLAAVLMGICAWMANGLLGSFLPQKLACIGAIGLAALIYAVLVLLFRVITMDDCLLLPGGKKIAKILRISA